MKAKANIAIDVTVRIIKVKGRKVTVEMEDGQRATVREGDRLTVATHADLAMNDPEQE